MGHMIAQKRPNAIAKVSGLCIPREKEQIHRLLSADVVRAWVRVRYELPLPEGRGYRFAHHQSCRGEDRQVGVDGIRLGAVLGLGILFFLSCF